MVQAHYKAPQVLGRAIVTELLPLFKENTEKYDNIREIQHY
jgi:hypothetical protein